MQPDSLDRDFQVFRQSRDPAALAAVFDAAAPRLLLVAMHLCRDAATAEDLVQTVFLQVLRDAERFDARRPVMPWLLAMLEHRASDHRHRAHVRRERAADANAAPPLATDASPERAAAAKEVRERVAEALQGMPRDYRDVLALRLVHGLSSVDIAHAQGLPPATVRTRLRRGLELLRGALPRGLATRGLLALLAVELTFARDGMAAVRTKVLAAAAVTAGTGITFAFGWWLALAAGVLLAAGGILWLAPDAATSLRSGENAATAVAANDSDEREHTRDVDTDASTTRPTTDRTEVADPRITTVRGRIVDATTGLPLVGVVVATHTHPMDGRESEPDWREPDPVTTGADGTFAVKFVPARRRYVEVLFNADGFVEESSYFERLRTGVDVDVGDVMLRPGTPVRLRLLCDGQPLGGVELWTYIGLDGQRPGGHGISDADGLVDLGICEPGPWRHRVESAHLGREGRFDVPLQRQPFLATVELRQPPRGLSIAGVLVDTSGAPVAGVELGMPWPSGGLLQAMTRTDGRFLWAMAVAPPGPVRERIELPRDKRGELEWVDNGGDVAWGTHDLRLVVRRRTPATLRLEVFDAATQQAVEAFGATCKAELGSCSAERRRVPAEHHAGGVATFELGPGAYYASVFAGEPFAESAEMPVQLVEGRTTTLRVPLRPPAELTVDVVDAVSGVPLEGVELALMKAVPAERARDFERYRYQEFRERPEMTSSGGKAQVIVLARGTSDARGRVSIRAPADVPGLVLVAGGPRCTASEHHDIVLPAGGARTTIRVTAAGVVRGVLTPRAFVERFGPAPERLAEAAANARTQWPEPDEFADDYPRIVLCTANGERAAGLGAHVAADGSFTIGGVPAGHYAVHVEEVIGNSRTDLGALATVVVDPASVALPLTVDASALVPARGTMRFFIDGAPATGKGGLARLVDGGCNRVTFPLAADGAATTPWLVPGTYVPFVVSNSEEHVYGTERLIVSAGGSVDATFSLQRRVVTITVLEATGEPARDVFLRVAAIDRPELMGARYCYWLRGRTDAEGHVALIAPPGRLRLHAFARHQDLRTNDVEPALLLGEVAADASAATFRMPPKAGRR